MHDGVVQNWKGLDGDRPAFLTSADDEAYMLRRTAIVTEQCLHLFDLDASPPVCSVYSPFPSTYKVKMASASGQRKPISVTDAAWSPVLGKDPLPKELLYSRLYNRSSLVVMLKVAGTLYMCSQGPDIATAPGLHDVSQQEKLGLTFAAAEFLYSQQHGQKKKQTGAKRGRPASKPTGELYSLLLVVQASGCQPH